MNRNLESKQRQFNAAMERYESGKIYVAIGKIISFVIISLQIYLSWKVFQNSMGVIAHGVAFLIAYALADLINGFVHLFMDNNDRYDSPAGPLIASFHLHHRTPLYKKKNIVKVYYHESGSKIWLAGFLLIAALFIEGGYVPPFVSYCIVYFSILSSVAEVSHYLCHVPGYPHAKYLRYAGLLLSKRHHRRHHSEDNVSYAFLNGMTDPILNVFARLFYSGYKQHTDLHYARYTGKGTENR